VTLSESETVIDLHLSDRQCHGDRSAIQSLRLVLDERQEVRSKC